MRLLLLLLTCLAFCHAPARSQDIPTDTSTIVLPTLLVEAEPRMRKLTLEERQAYWRRIRDVKKVLPYARYVAATIIETYEYAETLPDKEQRAHIKRVEAELKQELEPQMRKLTLGQGRLLIKLINRQSGSTGYELVKAFLGSWRAWWWNQFAKFMGANLKDRYAPDDNPDDAVTERIVRLIDAGWL